MRTAAPLQIGRPSCLHLKIFLRPDEHAFKKQDGWEVTGMDWMTGETVHRMIFGQNSIGGTDARAPSIGAVGVATSSVAQSPPPTSETRFLRKVRDANLNSHLPAPHLSVPTLSCPRPSVRAEVVVFRFECHGRVDFEESLSVLIVLLDVTVVHPPNPCFRR